MVRQQL